MGEKSFSSPISDTDGEEKKKKSTVMLLARLKVLRAVFISLHQTTKSRLGYKHIKPLSWVDEVH